MRSYLMRIFAIAFLAFSILTPMSATAQTEQQVREPHEPRTKVREIQLRPEPRSEVLLEGIKAVIWDNGSVTVTYSGSGKAGDRLGYHWEVNYDAGTYTTQRIPVTEPLAMQAQYSRTVEVITEDPFGLDVAESENTLVWFTDGSRITDAFNYISICDGKNTPLGTDWHADTCYKNPVAYNASQASSWTYCDFYNYNWGDDGTATWTDHYIEAYGYPNGNFDYTWNVDNWGESAALLSGTVRTF